MHHNNYNEIYFIHMKFLSNMSAELNVFVFYKPRHQIQVLLYIYLCPAMFYTIILTSQPMTTKTLNKYPVITKQL